MSNRAAAPPHAGAICIDYRPTRLDVLDHDPAPPCAACVRDRYGVCIRRDCPSKHPRCAWLPFDDNRAPPPAGWASLENVR